MNTEISEIKRQESGCVFFMFFGILLQVPLNRHQSFLCEMLGLTKDPAPETAIPCRTIALLKTAAFFSLEFPLC